MSDGVIAEDKFACGGAQKLVCRDRRMLLAAPGPVPSQRFQNDANYYENGRSRHAARDVCSNGTGEEKQGDEMFHCGILLLVRANA